MGVVVELPESLRGELKEPLGPVYTDAADLLADATEPLVAVGDVVTYHLLEAGYRPRVAVIDGRTERGRLRREVAGVLGLRPATDSGTGGSPGGAGGDGGAGGAGGAGEDTSFDWADAVVEVDNPPGTVTVDLLEALADALTGPDSTVVLVDGEEDLAVLPAVVAAPDGASVVYGQPGEGMVLAIANHDRRGVARDLLERMEGDLETFWRKLGVRR